VIDSRPAFLYPGLPGPKVTNKQDSANIQLIETARTVAIIFVWAITAIIAVGLVAYGFKVIRELTSFVRELLWAGFSTRHARV